MKKCRKATKTIKKQKIYLTLSNKERIYPNIIYPLHNTVVLPGNQWEDLTWSLSGKNCS